MKTCVLLLGLLCFTISVLAQPNADSLAYQLQRKKINNMLLQRTQKFGQYDASLSMHTGIFGLQTKKDIRRSNEILMDIVKTDNDIFKELKVLLDYRAFQQTQAQNRSAEIEKSNLAFMNTINRLRTQNKQLQQQLADVRAKSDKLPLGYVITIIVLILTSISLFIARKSARKA